MTFADDVRKIFLSVSPQWISFLLDVLQGIYLYVKQSHPEGLYEILEYEFRLELLDTKGQTALLTKRQRVKFLQDNVLAFEDYAWGDGNVLAGYRCTPGVIADRYREGERWNILISLRESKHRGDIQEFHIESRPENSLMEKEEWCQIEMQHRTRSAKLSVVFPKKRYCKQATLIERHRNRTLHLGPENFTTLGDGRQLLLWETIEPRQFETYTLKWSW